MTMRCNPDLFRKLMLIIKEAPHDSVDEKCVVSGYKQDEVAYHLGLIIEQGYAEGHVHYSSGEHSTIPDAVIVSYLTPAGENLISA